MFDLKHEQRVAGPLAPDIAIARGYNQQIIGKHRPVRVKRPTLGFNAIR